MAVCGTDREILETAVDWLAGGHSAALVTVVRSWGSSPRPAGSLMLIRDDGLYRGSASGGCVEEDLLVRYRERQFGGFPTLIDYGVDSSEARRLGLPCGGRLELLVEQLSGAAQMRTLLARVRDGELVARRVCLSTGEASLHSAGPGGEFHYSADSVTKVFGPRWRLLLIGAGQLSDYIAAIARMLDYAVVVCDPRRDYAQHPASEDTERSHLMPDEAVQLYATHPRTVVVAVTHDPRLDDMALIEALESPAFYVGAIGSRTNSDKRRERLAAMGVPADRLERLHAPVGLPIGSHSPPEIAVSVLAHITALRNAAVRAARDAADAA
jgi:xanthine dehydrogenase accessory factor